MIGGRILDTSALVQAARGTPYMQALLYISHEHLIPLVIPAPCPDRRGRRGTSPRSARDGRAANLGGGSQKARHPDDWMPGHGPVY